jgi:hypothetical protein
MKKLLLALVIVGLLLGLMIVGRAALATEPEPLVGNWYEDAKQGYFQVQGTFDRHTVVKFICYKQMKLCVESWAHVTDDKKFITVDSLLWEIDRWDSTTLISRDEVPICQTNQLQVDFKAKSLVVFTQPKNLSTTLVDACKGTRAEALELKYVLPLG